MAYVQSPDAQKEWAKQKNTYAYKWGHTIDPKKLRKWKVHSLTLRSISLAAEREAERAGASGEAVDTNSKSKTMARIATLIL